MMLKIKAAQSERNRLSMLLAEYIDDVVVSQNVCAIKSCKDSLWLLATELLSAFDYPDPTTHFMFEDAPEISEDGIKNILSFYEFGKSCFQQVLAEDVYKTEIPAPGHSLRNINSYSYAKLDIIKKQKNKNKGKNSMRIQEDVSTSHQMPLPSEANLPKQTRHTTTDAEKQILAKLFQAEEGMPETIIPIIVTELQTVSLDWTKERVKQYYKNN
ncbi:10786_t:CDS:1 [Racocetra fulgida]|uniref:10786_t:CDS:1 n=1 Tax=Racocetra fulgida TaxID=60492 RepID=A0A9N8YW67_9GLOM|nr:10786_t:CDS:1 [Racocetra fulgida]